MAKGPTTEQVERILSASVQSMAYEADFEVRVETYEERGIMTRDRGLVLRFNDGSEFQVTIMQSKGGRK